MRSARARPAGYATATKSTPSRRPSAATASRISARATSRDGPDRERLAEGDGVLEGDDRRAVDLVADLARVDVDERGDLLPWT